VGLLVGRLVGACVGDRVGDRLGDRVGRRVGDRDGLRVGCRDGALVGDFVGVRDGFFVGDLVGDRDGFLVGFFVGRRVGDRVGDLLGRLVGDLVGALVGAVSMRGTSGQPGEHGTRYCFMTVFPLSDPHSIGSVYGATALKQSSRARTVTFAQPFVHLAVKSAPGITPPTAPRYRLHWTPRLISWYLTATRSRAVSAHS
jgi:hypothetical protein